MQTDFDPELRRLPVYLLVDTSSSMRGPPIESVKESIKVFIQELNREPFTIGTVWVSIITFNNRAEQIIPLTEARKFPDIDFTANGMCELSSAFSLLSSCLAKDLRKRTCEHRGDYKPVIYVFTDGYPTDTEWEQALNILHRRSFDSFIAYAASNNADEHVLRKISDTVIPLQKGKSIMHFIIFPRPGPVSFHDNEPPVLPDCAEFIKNDDD